MQTLNYLENGDATAEERLLELRRWIVTQLRPVTENRPLSPLQWHDESVHTDEGDASEECDELGEVGDTDSESDQGECENNHDTMRPSGNKRLQRGKRRQEIEWELRYAVLRLTSALVVLCEAEYMNVFLGDLHDRKGCHGRKTTSGPNTMIDVLHRVVAFGNHTRASTIALGHQELQLRSKLRMEAMQTLAIVCLMSEDPKLCLEVCNFLSQRYFTSFEEKFGQRQDEYRDLWERNVDDSEDEEEDSTNEDGSNDSEAEEKDYDSDQDDSEQDSEEELTHRCRVPDVEDGEYAMALNVCSFLFSVIKDATEVTAFIRKHQEALVSMLFAKPKHDLKGLNPQLSTFEALPLTTYLQEQ